MTDTMAKPQNLVPTENPLQAAGANPKAPPPPPPKAVGGAAPK